jgi:hypothetical protein
MTNEDRPRETGRTTIPRPAPGRLVLLSLAVLVVVGLLAAVLVRRSGEDGTAPASTEAPASSEPSRTTVVANLETELADRLREILSQRDAAYRSRNPAILRQIYTVDCPCLESDSNAIRELLSNDYLWVGGETSIQVRRFERVSNRLWLIIADFVSQSLRIETESGRLVRTEPRGSDLFQFALAKPSASSRWLLGRATSYKDG